ncbi:hypothetical protein ACOME3_001948 [Neoechinorhynchus agilis]
MSIMNGSAIVEAKSVLIPAERILDADEQKQLLQLSGIERQHSVQIERHQDEAGNLALKIHSPSQLNIQRATTAVLFNLTMPERIPIPVQIPRQSIGELNKRMAPIEHKYSCHILAITEPRKRPEIVVRFTHPNSQQNVVAEINEILRQEANFSIVKIRIPALYHPWIKGGFGKKLKHVTDTVGYGVREIVFTYNEIILRGESEACEAAKEMIERIYQKYAVLEKSTMTVDFSRNIQAAIRANNSFVWNKILEQTDVVIEMPSPNARTFRCDLCAFENYRLTEALTMIQRECNTTIEDKVDVPLEYMEYLKARTQSPNSGIRSNSVSLQWDSEFVKIKGNRSDVSGTVSAIQNLLTSLRNTYMDYKIREMDEACGIAAVGYHNEHADRYMRLKNVLVTYDKDEQEVKVQGPRTNVDVVLNDLQPRLERVKNEVVEKLKINWTFHRILIGPHGSVINGLRREFRVEIKVPDIRDRRSEDVTIRGDKVQVEQCIKRINQIIDEVNKEDFETIIHVKKDLHRIIIGRNGSTISDLRRKHNNVGIDVPSVDSVSTEIRISGMEADVLDAKKSIETLIESVKEVEVPIPPLLMDDFLFNKRLRPEYLSTCPETVRVTVTDSNSFRLIGPSDDVNRFKEFLLSKADSSEAHEAREMRISGRMVQYMLSYDDTYVFDKVRRQLNTRVDYKSHNDRIILYGADEDADAAVAEIKKVVDGMGVLVEKEVDVSEIKEASSFARLFGMRRYLLTLGGQFGVLIDPLISDGEHIEKIFVCGKESDVKEALVKVNEIVSDWKEAEKFEVDFPLELIQSIRSNARHFLRPLEIRLNVYVLFPSDANERLTVVGRKDKCDEAINDLKDSATIEKIISIPSRFHSRLLGRRGGEVNRIKEQSGIIEIKFPPKDQGDDVILKGTKSSIEEAERIMAEVVERKSPEPKGGRTGSRFEHQAVINVPKAQHPIIIGRGGRTINDLRRTYDVEIRVPQPEDDASNETVVIRGSTVERCEMVAGEIQRMLNGESDRPRRSSPFNAALSVGAPFSKQVIISTRAIPLLIGTRGRAINAFRKEHNVNVKFNAFDEHPDVVVVSGATESAIDEAIDELCRLAERAVANLPDNASSSSPPFAAPNSQQSRQTRAPDFDDLNEFPAFQGN